MARNLRAIDWTDYEIERLSNVSPEALQGAYIWWNRYGGTRHTYAPVAFNVGDSRGLRSEAELRAWIRDELPKQRLTKAQKALFASGALLLFWRGRYYTQAGRLVSGVRIDARKAITRQRLAVKSEYDRVRVGDESLAQLQRDIAGTIRDEHVAMALIASGGVLATGVPEYVSAMVRGQLLPLRAMFLAIADASLKLDGGILRRLRMYVTSGWGTLWGVSNITISGWGGTLQRNVLGPNENHCGGPNGCPAVSNKGWQPTGVLPAIGTRACMTNCLCHWEYMNPITGETW